MISPRIPPKPLITIVILVVLAGSLLLGGFTFGQAAIKNGHYKLARFFFTVAAVQGNPSAQSNLAAMYAEGLGGPRNDTAAAKWFDRSARQGVAQAQFNLSNMYEEGRGVPRSTPRAVELLQAAAEQGDMDAAFNLGSILVSGRDDLAKDIPMAVRWYNKAAAAGHTSAQYNLASLYTNGQNMPKNWIPAIKWLTPAAANGHAKAQLDLGTIYAYGLSGDRQFDRGLALLRMAAKHEATSSDANQRLAEACHLAINLEEAALCAIH